jgi:pyruvate,water dikinase
VAQVIDVAKEKGRKIGICGQAPSDFPDFAEFLVECGIDSLSLNPDSVIKVIRHIAEIEQPEGTTEKLAEIGNRFGNKLKKNVQRIIK